MPRNSYSLDIHGGSVWEDLEAIIVAEIEKDRECKPFDGTPLSWPTLKEDLVRYSKKHPTLILQISFWNEDGGYNMGTYVAFNGKIVWEWEMPLDIPDLPDYVVDLLRK